MTTSPYDNLPNPYNDNPAAETAKKKNLQYIDVDIEEAGPQEMEMPASEKHEITEPAENVQPSASSQQPNPQPKSYPNQHTVSQPKQQPTPQPNPPRRSRTKTIPIPNPPQYSSISIKNRTGRNEYILPFEESLLVPDTMPDMGEILFAEANIHTARPAGNAYESNDFISGDVTFYTVYRPDSEESCPVDVIKSSIPFKTDKCWGNSSCTFRASASVRAVTAEKINERKFTARGQLVFRVTEISRQELPVFKESPDPELICRHDTINAADLTLEAEDTTEISQEINIKDGDPEPVKILKESIHIVENHKQIASGKLVINGVIISDILYLGEEAGEKKLCSFANKTDFTQFIPVKGEPDINMITADFTGSELQMNIAGTDQFRLQGHIRTLICGYSSTELPMVCDAYHKSRELNFDIAQSPVTDVIGTVSGEISAREVISIDDAHNSPARILNGTYFLSEINGRVENGRIIIDGSIPVKLLATDESNRPFVIESTVPLRGSLEMAQICDDSIIEVSAAVKEFWYDEINSRQIEVNISTSISVWVCRSHTFTSITQLSFMESDEAAPVPSLAVYVTAGEDTLWDIAKRYKTDADAIASTNSLDKTQPLPEGKKLLIMK